MLASHNKVTIAENVYQKISQTLMNIKSYIVMSLAFVSAGQLLYTNKTYAQGRDLP